MDLRTAEGLVELTRSEIFAELPIQQLGIIVKVALNPGITHSELAEELVMPQGTVSRNVKRLSTSIGEDDDGNVVKIGLDILQNKPDDRIDSRRAAVWLTKRGKAFVRKLQEL